MKTIDLFLPCPAGVENWLLEEVKQIATGAKVRLERGGVLCRASWADMLKLNLYSRLAQRVLMLQGVAPYYDEGDLYNLCKSIPWEDWFTPLQTIKVDVTAQHSPLKSLNFAALRIKDGVCDRLRDRLGDRPNVETRYPDMRIHLHLTQTEALIYLDTSGQPLFKRGWREDKGEAPLKETLAAAMLAASGWQADMPLLDPCCGSGTIVIEAAQMASGMAAGAQRRFAFEKMRPFVAREWQDLRQAALAHARQQQSQRRGTPLQIYAGDVSFRMTDFALRNAQRAGVDALIEFKTADALQRMPPSDHGMILMNPPYGERIMAQGTGSGQRSREADGGAAPDDFFTRLAAHWKRHYAGWSAFLLSPDPRLPAQMRLKESRRTPMWNGPIECRLFRFDLVAGSMRKPPAATPAQ